MEVIEAHKEPEASPAMISKDFKHLDKYCYTKEFGASPYSNGVEATSVALWN
jgi:hypothetical protein